MVDHRIAEEMRSLVTWNWGHLTADQLVELTRQALTPSAERVRETMRELCSSGDLIRDDEWGRFTLGNLPVPSPQGTE